jgi:hydroxymethylpyrimidine pyrophosphatase-like HAD family hydrolase
MTAVIDTADRNGKALFVTDFDGTLVQSDGTVAKKDIEALERLGELGIVRAIATGRSLHSFNKTARYPLPIDYIIFSTGLGVMGYPGGKYLRTVDMHSSSVGKASAILRDRGLDYMVHLPVPDNHRFIYRLSGRDNPDFARRPRTAQRSLPGNGPSDTDAMSASQLLAILPPEIEETVFEDVRFALPECNIIKTTSPLDGRTRWMEIFPGNVSKGRTTAWLAEHLGIVRENVAAIGNDYNDIDMLEWSGKAYVVKNAPESMKKVFIEVASNEENGLSEAVDRWIEDRCN